MTCTQSAILGQPATKFSRYFVTVGTTDWINFSSVLLRVLYIWMHVWAAWKERWLFEGTVDQIFLDISVKATWAAQSTATFYALDAGAKALTALVFGQMTTRIYTCIPIKLIKPQKTQPARNLASAFKKSAIAQGGKNIHSWFLEKLLKLKALY